MSGSGKTTLASKLAKENNAELIELDCFECCYQFATDDQLKQAGQVFYDYLSNHRQLWYNLKIKKIKGKDLGDEIDKFLKYCISYCKKDKDTKYVIEGVQIYNFLEKQSLGNIPIIMTGASALTSIARRLKRAKNNSNEDFKNQLAELPQCIFWYIDEENSYKKFMKAITESTSGMSLYHVSENNLDGKTLTPKIPNNYLTKNGYEDCTTKRTCFSSSINGCLLGMSMNLKGKELYIHAPSKGVKYTSPTKQQVPDSNITGEQWVLEPVELKCIGKIKVLKSIGSGHSYSYGDNKSAKLYDWEWRWIEKF